jgi:hypothetical protein
MTMSVFFEDRGVIGILTMMDLTAEGASVTLDDSSLVISSEGGGQPLVMTERQHQFVRDVVGVRSVMVDYVTLTTAHIETIFQMVRRSDVATLRLNWYDPKFNGPANCDAVVRGIELLRSHKIRSLEISADTGIISAGMTERLIAAVNELPKLQMFKCHRIDLSVTDLMNLRKDLISVKSTRMSMSDNVRSKMRTAIESYWNLTNIPVGVCTHCDSTHDDNLIGNVDRDKCSIVMAVVRNRSMTPRLVHESALDICIALLPLRLPAYIVLWIADWIPPHHHRFERGDYRENLCDYDPRHMLKIRLIEGIAKSYDALRR